MITVKSIMTPDVITVSPESSLLDAAKKIVPKSVSGLVVAEHGMPIAIISERDIINGIISKKQKVSDVMSTCFQVISPKTNFSKISSDLRKTNIKRFPVVENGRLIGLVTETDIIEATRDFTRLHQITQEVILIIFGLATAFFLFYFSKFGASRLG